MQNLRPRGCSGEVLRIKQSLDAQHLSSHGHLLHEAQRHGQRWPNHYHAVLLASHKQAKKTNGSKLKDFFYPYPNPVGLTGGQKQDAKPLIFKKKQKDVKVIPLKVKTNDTGQIRHFTPAAQE